MHCCNHMPMVEAIIVVGWLSAASLAGGASAARHGVRPLMDLRQVEIRQALVGYHVATICKIEAIPDTRIFVLRHSVICRSPAGLHMCMWDFTGSSTSAC